MNALDLAIVALVLFFAYLGWHNGLLTGLWAAAGLYLGTMLGIVWVPLALAALPPSTSLGFVALLLVTLTAVAGRFAMVWLESRIKHHIAWRPQRVVDRAGGIVFGAVSVLMVSWMIGLPVAKGTVPLLSDQASGSLVLRTVDKAPMPVSHKMMAGLDRVVRNTPFPRYLQPFQPERIVPVAAAPAAVVDRPGVRRAAASVVKIRGNTHCGLGGSQGSGFTVARERVLTNAHVVAGTSRLKVLEGSRSLAATVVYFDPEVDLAVLRVPDLRARPVRFAAGAAKQAGAAIGFPLNGPQRVVPARIRDAQTLQSPDIYDDTTVERRVFSLRTTTRPGNSGGPLVNVRGRVLGVVFAGSSHHRDTSYALTSAEVAPAVSAGVRASEAVADGHCPG